MHKDAILITPAATECPDGKCPIIMWSDFPQSAQVGYPYSEMGRSRIKIECCECKGRDWYFIWSMSGLGMARCKCCGAMIAKSGLHTVPKKLYDRILKDWKRYKKHVESKSSHS